VISEQQDGKDVEVLVRSAPAMGLKSSRLHRKTDALRCIKKKQYGISKECIFLLDKQNEPDGPVFRRAGHYTCLDEPVLIKTVPALTDPPAGTCFFKQDRNKKGYGLLFTTYGLLFFDF
jgi:hypothetical protein